METSKQGEQNNGFLDRATRATRGKRMSKLLDDEAEEDELFWNQEALKDEENDVEYEEEGDAVDVFDSDFDEDEPDADEEAENEPDERTRTKKKLIFPGKAPAKKKKKASSIAVSRRERASKEEETQEQLTPSEDQDAHDDGETEKVVRKSTRTSVVIRQAERDAIRAAMEATMKPIKRKKEGEEKRMTQEEMLLEAAQTEIMNLRNLEKVLAREEEVKKRAIVHKEVYSGPQIRYLSKNGDSYLGFMNGASFESQLSTTPPPYPEKAVCAITGLPASYRDPKTALPFATKEAFKIIRERFDEESKRSRTESRMGLLPDVNNELSFSQKRNRSVIPHDKEAFSNLRNSARFRRFPPPEIEDSD